MPAIDLARLKTQAARLSEKFGLPNAFVHDLNELLDLYTNHTIRAMQTVRRLSLPTYHTPRPVMRQIEGELDVLAESHPKEAIALTKALWEAGSLESRLLAAHLLGSIPTSEAIPALQRLPDWLGQSTDKQVHTALLTSALARLRRENPEAFFSLLEGWLGSPRSGLQVWGLQALVPLLKDSGFENLPAVLRILRPAVRAAGPATQLDLQTCLVALERVSPTETLAFLREILADNPSPMLQRTLRRILPAFSPEMQTALRAFLRSEGGQE
jgi:hypothetical protein